MVVTVIVLLILASVTITTVFSDNGIIAKAQEAANKTQEAVNKEQAELNQLYNDLSDAINNVGGGSTTEESEKPIGGEYSESEGVNTPQYYASQMTPIKWDTELNDWVETTGSDPEWYDYSAKKWANAKTSDGSMWVWIPRYAYSIMSGYHQSGAEINSNDGANGANSAGTIEIEFMKGVTNETSTGRTIFQNASGQENWNIHPAFNYGQIVSGIWVAKFEASSVQGNSNNSSGDNVTTKTLQVKSGVESWRYIDVGNIYTVCLNYNKTLNSHMMKNDEWGAVAYLSKSKYGKNSEVTINNNSLYYTGGGTGNAYVDNTGQSTTGTVEGIYDMCGGAWEYVASYVNNGNQSLLRYGASLVNAGNGVNDTNEKTKNVYNVGSDDSHQSNYEENKGKYGDAIWETSNNSSASNGAWYADHTTFSSSSSPFFLRGCSYNNGTNAGLFSFFHNSGFAYEDRSFHPVLIVL